ncbi:OTU-like cysteine protease family protein [Reticulomyxa filosa]|uniref:OTU-like cysteine protease family protein n=1 Tax=Reticulomyxa filosa TaxID=46433 RepID=X6NHK4_RETFI|nr:OTU-like cysteine protease family protein [Reticulomyxa filosa]|eukprot:ETO25805.1 OTU-like cysteine protease family protein [Reticulomyxa filosa]
MEKHNKIVGLQLLTLYNKNKYINSLVGFVFTQKKKRGKQNKKKERKIAFGGIRIHIPMGKKNKSKKVKHESKEKQLWKEINTQKIKQSKEIKKQFRKESKKKQYASDWNKFCDQLREMNLSIKDTNPDGNCLFRSLADQLHGDERMHGQYRKEIVEYMQSHAEQFASFCTDDFEKYLKGMSKSGTWGGNLELTAASRVYQIDICVHQLGAARYEILYSFGKPKRSIHVSYHNERHYASVRKMTDRFTSSPAEVIDLDDGEEDRVLREQQRQEIASWFSHDHGSSHINVNEINIDTHIYHKALSGDKDIPITTISATSVSSFSNESSITHVEMQIMQTTQCEDLQHIRDILMWNENDLDATIEYLITEQTLHLDADFDQKHADEPIISSNSNQTDILAQSQTQQTQNPSNEPTQTKTSQPQIELKKSQGSSAKDGSHKCPCGSGRKYKKCCDNPYGGSSKRAATADADKNHKIKRWKTKESLSEEKELDEKKKEDKPTEDSPLDKIKNWELQIQALASKKKLKQKLINELETLKQLTENPKKKDNTETDQSVSTEKSIVIAI